MKNFLILLLLCLFTACESDDPALLPVGFEHVSLDGPSHFVLVHQEYWGKRNDQKKVGREICVDIFKEANYCEVYYFANRKDIPLKFPITNRLKPIGLYGLKNGVQTFKALSLDDLKPDEETHVIFYKNFYKHFSGFGSSKSKKDEKNK